MEAQQKPDAHVDSTHTILPSDDFQSVNAPETSEIALKRAELTEALDAVPVLAEGLNPDGTTVRYRNPAEEILFRGADYNHEAQLVSFMVEADLRQVEGMELVLFDDAGAEIPDVRAEMRKVAEWKEPGSGEPLGQFHVELKGEIVKPGMHYAFRPLEKEAGPGISPDTRWAGDPYGKAIVPTQYTAFEKYDSDVPILGMTHVVPQKSVMISMQEHEGVVSFPGVEGLEPITRVPLEQAPHGSRVFYEMHIKDTQTVPDEIMEDNLKGTQGTVKALQSQVVIDRLKDLGITHLELLPMQSYLSEYYLQAEGAVNAWGYMPESYHGLHGDYFHAQEAHAQIREMIETINVLHENGIAVILDWVSGHTTEADEIGGPSAILRPFAEELYYSHDEEAAYTHESGCGNTVQANYEMQRNLLLSSRDWYLNSVGFDGLRVDQAALLGRGRDGLFHDDHGFLEKFTTRGPGLEDKIFIAEPNDVGPEELPFFNGSFPYREPGSNVGWDGEWLYRSRNLLTNDVATGFGQSFFEGNGRALGRDLATWIAGNDDIYTEGRNYGVMGVAYHDGLTALDAARRAINLRFDGVDAELREDIRAGFGELHAPDFMLQTAAQRIMNIGKADGHQLNNPEVRERLARQLAVSMLASNILRPGDVLINRGDEDLRSQDGEHDAFRHPEYLGLNWQSTDSREILAGVMKLRQELGVFDTAEHFKERPGLAWFDRAGRLRQSEEEWDRINDGFLASYHYEEEGAPVLVVRGEGQYLLPEAPHGFAWISRFDSTRDDPFEEKILGKTAEDDVVRSVATLYGAAGVAVYELAAVSVEELENYDVVFRRLPTGSYPDLAQPVAVESEAQEKEAA